MFLVFPLFSPFLAAGFSISSTIVHVQFPSSITLTSSIVALVVPATLMTSSHSQRIRIAVVLIPCPQLFLSSTITHLYLPKKILLRDTPLMTLPSHHLPFPFPPLSLLAPCLKQPPSPAIIVHCSPSHLHTA
ncbi:hypothetical protein BDZ97DRAFT_1782764 [Flammula alnicola]|nr:hypothetical protein BDZ97DRAFT_1782764 [Flammula alnicola]